MNKRQIKPIAYDYMAHILMRAINNGDHLGFMDDEKDDDRLAEIVEEFADTLADRASRRTPTPARGKQ